MNIYIAGAYSRKAELRIVAERLDDFMQWLQVFESPAELAAKVSDINMPDDIRETVEKMMEFRERGISIQ